MSVNLGSAHGKIELDGSGAKRGVSEATSAVASLESTSESLSKKFASMGETLTKTGKKLTAGVTLPIVGIGVAAAKMQIDFDREMRNVSSISDTTRKNFEGIKKEVLDLSTKVPQSATVLAKGLYEIASSGYDGADAMLILEASAKAAAAGLTDTNISADAATTVLNAWGMKASDVGKVQDIMFETVKRGKLTYEQLAGSLSTVASTAAAANVPFEQVAGAYATMTKAGITADEAATALNQTLLSYISPTTEAKEAAAALGLDISATALSTKGLTGVVAELTGKLGTSASEIEKLTKSGKSEAEIQQILAKRAGMTVEQFGALFGNVRALKGILSLTRDEGKVFADDVEGMYKSTGAAADAYAEQSKSLAIQLELMKSSLSKTAIEFGEVMAPAIAKAAAAIGKFADWLGKLSPAQKKMVVGILIAVAAIGPLLLILGQVAFAISSIISLVGILAPIFAAVAGAISAPVLIVIGIIAALAAAAYLVYKNWDTVKAWLIKVWESISSAASSAWSAVVAAFEGALAAVSGVIQSIKNVIIGLWDILTGGPEDVRMAFEVLSQTFGGIFLPLGAAWNAIRTLFTTTIPNIVGQAIQFFAELPGKILSFWLQLPGHAAYALGLLLGTVARFGTDIFNGIVGTLQRIPEALNFVWNLVKQGALLYWNSLKYFYLELIPTIVRAIVNQIALLPGRLAAIWNSIKNAATSAWNSLKNYLATVVPAMINATASFFARLPSRVATSFTSLYNGVVSRMKQVATAIANLTRGAVDKAVSFFAGLPNKILSYISRLPGQLYSMASRIASSFWNGFKKGLGIHSPSYVEQAFIDMQASALAAVNTIKKSTGKLSSLSSMATQIATPATMLAPAVVGPSNITVQNNFNGPWVVRDQSDIMSIARELHSLQDSATRGVGVGRNI